jgi:hypothetical protein
MPENSLKNGFSNSFKNDNANKSVPKNFFKKNCRIGVKFEVTVPLKPNSNMKKLIFISLLSLLLSCSKDACDGITCVNGDCVNGQCDCEQGYTGPSCATQLTPTKIRITKIVVTKFPATDNGAGWDLTSGPDIRPKLFKGNTEIWASPDYFENADPANDYTFTLSPVFDIESPTDQHSLSLYDYDSADPDDFMGGVTFTPYSSTNNFPTQIILDCPTCTVSFTVTVSYVF